MSFFMVSWPNINLVADALGWAVLHSLWQGVVAAAIIYAVRALTRERASELRYFVGVITLCALLFAFVGTFFYYYATGIMTAGVGTTTTSLQTITIAMSEKVTASNPLLRFANYTSPIGMLWAFGFVVLGIRYLSAFRLTHKLRTTGLSDLPTDWQTRFVRLAAKSGVSGKVRAYFSKHVSSPITFGFWKPIVLLPTWFFTGMTPEQCEAVILHELAHIRRHDYLTNILQIAIKTVFFYHPAVGFICKGMDTDREHACDDFAVRVTNNPESLATALGIIRLKSARDGGVFALSASGADDGRDAPLMGRLKRLMGTHNARTGGTSLRKGTSRGLAATALLVSASALVLILGTSTSQAHPDKQELEVLAGASTKVYKHSGNNFVVVDGNVYNTNGRQSIVKNGRIYATGSGFSYGAHRQNGKTYIVKTDQGGNSHIQINGNWYNVNGRPQMNIVPPPVPPTQPLPPTPPTTNYWVSEQDWQANEDRIEQANERRETALERAAEQREAALEQVQERREAALERAEEQRGEALERSQERRERAEERRQEARERAADQREAEIERKQAHLRQKIELKKQALEGRGLDRAKKINKLQQKIKYKRAKLKNARNMSHSELGRLQGEIDRLQGEIGRMQGEGGRGHGELGRLQSELGQLQGELGHIQGKWGQKRAALEQKKYYAMRDRLIPVLIADGYMKSDHSKVTIKMTPTDIFINGKQLSNAKEKKYCDIVSEYFDRKGDVKKIVIKPGYLHISQKGSNGKSNYSYTHNEN